MKIDIQKIVDGITPVHEPYKGTSEWEKQDKHWVYQRTRWSITINSRVYSGYGACIRIPFCHKEYFPKQLWDIYFPLGIEITNVIIQEAKRIGIYIK